MFINDVNKKEEIRSIATQHLRKYGVKYRPKKIRPPGQVARCGKKFFKVPLQNLETETVTLSNGQQLVIPKRVHEMCSYILSKVQTEGIFRKEGSKSRQNEIKLSLDRGCLLGNEHHIIDVAAVLKCFLRELPEPLIPQAYHELFLRCSIADKKLEAILLACLLLPTEHLNVLSYLMQFFNEVASFSTYNKMSYSNLSILVGPNIFPIDEKMVPKSSLMITKICDITKLLIENSRNIGFIPEYIIDQIGQLSDVEVDKRRKNKRRSGSLTRMLNGLKKIVGGKSEEESCPTSLATPDLLLTPSIHNSARKRKGDGGLSLKKKKELITKLPDCALLNTPFTPSRTPVSINPNGKKANENTAVHDKNIQESQREKKMHWYMRSRSMKSLKDDNESTASSTNNSRRSSGGPRAMLERRWSAVSNAANFRRKKRNSCAATKKEIAIVESKVNRKQDEPDFKTEYEDIRNRVSEIERRISLELDNVQSHMDSDNDNNVNRELDSQMADNIESVQTAYEKTLGQAESLSPTTDQLARRLSKDLRIRRSVEQKIIRSPSARKIGTIRRRSGECDKKSSQIVRNQSWHVGNVVTVNTTAPLIPRISLKRKKCVPNAVTNKGTGNYSVSVKSEKTPPPDTNNSTSTNLKRSTSFPRRSQRKKKSSPRAGSSPCTFTGESPIIQSSSQYALTVGLSESHSSIRSTCNTTGGSTDYWMSAEGFFNSGKTPQESATGNSRASIAKLRSQNVGMVRAKARLFDNIKDSDTSSSSIQSTKSQPGSARKLPTRTGYKVSSARSSDKTRMSYRVRALRNEDRKSKKNSISPRRRHVNMSQKQRLQTIGRQYARNRENSMEISQNSSTLTTPRRDLNNIDSVITSPRRTPHQNVPYIKMPLAVKTPKRLCRTPGVDRRTPLRVLATPM